MIRFHHTLLCLSVLTLFSVPALAATSETPSGLKNESEAGIVLTSGNTETATVSLKQSSAYLSGLNTYKFGASYLRTSNRGNEQALIWGLGLRYERALSDDWSLYLGQLAEGNKYQNILQRYATDVGGKYVFRNLEEFKWIGELGYRFARENYTGAPSQNIHFARFYSEAQYLLSPSVVAKLWAELLPNLKEMDAFQFNTEASLSATLSDLFSLKTAYLLRLNNEPPANAAKTDKVFTTSLVAKF